MFSPGVILSSANLPESIAGRWLVTSLCNAGYPCRWFSRPDKLQLPGQRCRSVAELASRSSHLVWATIPSLFSEDLSHLDCDNIFCVVSSSDTLSSRWLDVSFAADRFAVSSRETAASLRILSRCSVEHVPALPPGLYFRSGEPGRNVIVVQETLISQYVPALKQTLNALIIAHGFVPVFVETKGKADQHLWHDPALYANAALVVCACMEDYAWIVTAAALSAAAPVIALKSAPGSELIRDAADGLVADGLAGLAGKMVEFLESPREGVPGSHLEGLRTLSENFWQKIEAPIIYV